MDNKVNPVERKFESISITNVAEEETHPIVVAPDLSHFVLLEFISRKNHHASRGMLGKYCV